VRQDFKVGMAKMFNRDKFYFVNVIIHISHEKNSICYCDLACYIACCLLQSDKKLWNTAKFRTSELAVELIMRPTASFCF
jgi:hypothetical protein